MSFHNPAHELAAVLLIILILPGYISSCGVPSAIG